MVLVRLLPHTLLPLALLIMPHQCQILVNTPVPGRSNNALLLCLPTNVDTHTHLAFYYMCMVYTIQLFPYWAGLLLSCPLQVGHYVACPPRDGLCLVRLDLWLAHVAQSLVYFDLNLVPAALDLVHLDLCLFHAALFFGYFVYPADLPPPTGF